MTTLLDFFCADLEVKPDDWTTRLIFADALDEAGWPIEALGQRWQAKHRKQPLRSIIRGAFSWWLEVERPIPDNDPESDIEESVFHQLDNAIGSTGLARFFATVRAADSALAKALDVCGEQA
jgi:uncharacterized protein (TIGR02996 family)